MISSLFRLFIFFLYLGFLFFFPFSLLWGNVGLALGATAWIVFLGVLGWNAPRRVAKRMNARPLSRSEAPYLFHVTEELCRRAELSVPKVWILSSKVPNVAVVGFRKNAAELIITSELLNLKRNEQIALVGRAITVLVRGNALNNLWLSQFLVLIDTWLGFSRRGTDPARESDSIRHFLLQSILYPLALFPISLLGRSKNPLDLDKESILISREPLALPEAYRKIEAALHNYPFTVPLSTFHLFIAEPKRQDVLMGILFRRRSLVEQIRFLNPLRTSP